MKDKITIIATYILFVYGISVLWRYIGQYFPRMIGNVNITSFYIMLLFAIIFLIIKLIDKKPFSHYGFKKFNYKQFKLMIWFLFLVMPLAFLARVVDPGFDAWYASRSGLDTFTGFMIFALIMPFFVIKEELVVRAIFQNKLHKYGFWWMAVGLSTAFAIAHYFPSPTGHTWMQTASVLIGSFILVACYELTKNIWLSIMLHLFYNVIIILQIYLHVTNPTNEIIFWVIVLGIFAYLFVKMLINRKHYKNYFAHFKKGFKAIRPWEIAFLITFALIVPLLMIWIMYS
ncbi:MAG: CPBP family intramembrane metalloprotease [Nanoarchaeota archaeon]|nr:CPBP family intramembrane metalloprotease [Nanoarchaeota archaeon]